MTLGPDISELGASVSTLTKAVEDLATFIEDLQNIELPEVSGLDEKSSKDEIVKAIVAIRDYQAAVQQIIAPRYKMGDGDLANKLEAVGGLCQRVAGMTGPGVTNTEAGIYVRGATVSSIIGADSGSSDDFDLPPPSMTIRKLFTPSMPDGNDDIDTSRDWRQRHVTGSLLVLADTDFGLTNVIPEDVFLTDFPATYNLNFWCGANCSTGWSSIFNLIALFASGESMALQIHKDTGHLRWLYSGLNHLPVNVTLMVRLDAGEYTSSDT